MTKRQVIQSILLKKVMAKIADSLRVFSDYVSYAETLTQLGTRMNVSGVKGQVLMSADDIKEHLDTEVFDELCMHAAEGRAFLEKIGFSGGANVAPAALLKGDDPSIPGSFVQHFSESMPGRVTTNGIVVTPVPTSADDPEKNTEEPNSETAEKTPA